MDAGFKKLGVRKLKPQEGDLTLCSSKYILVSFTADIKRQFCQAVSGLRKHIEHFSCIGNDFFFPVSLLWINMISQRTGGEEEENVQI